MLRLSNKLSLVNKRRTLRALYAQSQGYPYAATLSSTFSRTTGGQLALGSGAGVGAAAIYPGAVLRKLTNETVTLSTADTQAHFGLSANFVGGTMDELGDQANIGVWRGRNSVFEVLAPVFDDTGLAAAAAAEVGTVATQVNLSAQATGLLSNVAATAPVARLLSRLSANAIIVELLN